MTRISTFIALAFAALCVLFVLVLTFQPALAQEAERVIAPSSVWFDIWSIIQPLVVLLASTVGPVLVTWIAARLISLLKIADEKQKLEIEAKLRQALHDSATNALKFAMARSGISGGVIGNLAGATVTSAVLHEATKYVERKNPDALQKLGVTPDALQDILMSKVPDLLGQHSASAGA
jgi:Mn2+/Fe2+ NRAMP family transporter